MERNLEQANCIAVIVNRSLDIVEYDLHAAQAHRRELINDYGFARSQVKLIGFASEKILYEALEKAGIHC